MQIAVDVIAQLIVAMVLVEGQSTSGSKCLVRSKNGTVTVSIPRRIKYRKLHVETGRLKRHVRGPDKDPLPV